MHTARHRDVLTTGEVAQICRVAPRTVSKWFDTGTLKGYRIPGSRDRRIPRGELIAFMREHGMPLEGLDGGSCRVLFVGDPLPADLLAAADATGRYAAHRAGNGFEAGVLAEQIHPHAVVLLLGPDPDDALALCHNVKSSDAFASAGVVALVPQGMEMRPQWRAQGGFDAVVAWPCEFRQLAAAIESVTNLIA